MKFNVLLCTIFMCAGLVVQAGLEEEATLKLIALFKTLIKNNYIVEVNNAETALKNGQIRDALLNLLHAGKDISSSYKDVEFGDARISHAKRRAEKQIITEMVNDLLKGNEKNKFLDLQDQVTLESLKQEISN